MSGVYFWYGHFMEKKETESTQALPRNFFSLLRSYSQEFFALDSRPLFDRTFSFPWKPLSESLSSLFGVEITLTPQEFKWRNAQDLYQGIVLPILPLSFSFPHIDGTCSLAISRTDIELLMKESLHISLEQLLKEDPSFFDQFWAFSSLEFCAAAQCLEPLKSLSPRLVPSSALNEPGYLSFDIGISVAQKPSLARLFIPSRFLESWKTFRAPQARAQAFLPDLTLPISLEAGRTFIKAKDLPSFKRGDVLLIDHPFIIPGSEKSRVYLTYHGKPLFRGKLKEDGVKILEMPLQHEAFIPLGEMSMSTQEPIPETFEENEELSPENPPQEKIPPKVADEASPTEEKEDLPPMTEEDVKEISKKATLITKKPLKIEDIPLPVVVQLAEISMSTKELSSLQPGNLLNLDIRPEDGVSLVVNGRVIAQGELVLIGDNVGVRIQEIELET